MRIPLGSVSMLTLLRHLLAIAILPLAVTVLVPFWIAGRYGITLSLGTSGGAVLLQGASVVVLIIGLLLFSSSLRGFAVEGKGTLAPWDPPRRLVVHGPYRYVRNPMISGVVFILAGEALLLRSRPHALWALVFLGINLIYIPLLEEPILRLRFGEAYREYCKHVPRVFPRLRPWLPAPADRDAA
jgi:protein-S-isoprenylcysteine O-methyltransferase Ste14